MDFIPRNARSQPTVAGQAGLSDKYFEPDTGDVVGAFVEESFKGVGTLNADLLAADVKKTERAGTPLTAEAYRESPFYRPGIPYYRTMTAESAKILADNNDRASENARIINKASTSQYALGIAAGFGTGIFEPKNAALGLAVSAATYGIGGAITTGAGSLRRIMQLKRSLGNYGTKAAIGGAEGMVAAAIAEPSNRYSAKILKQDYTMADTAWNIGLSMAFGAAANTVPGYVRERFVTRGQKTRQPEIMAAEIDTAVSQLSEGKRVDVENVMASERAQATKLPIREQAALAESVVKYTETPEFKARFEGSKVVDEQGAPMVVYKGMHPYDWTKETATDMGPLIEKIGRTTEFPAFNKGEEGVKIAGFFGDKVTADRFTKGSINSAIYPVYLNFKKPHVIDAAGKFAADIQFGESGLPFREAIRSGQYDGVIIKNTKDEGDVYVALNSDSIISAFGADDLPAITKRIEAENAARASQSVIDERHPDNDTAIDFQAWKELDEAEAAEPAITDYQQEIADMKREGQLTEADEKAMLQAFEDLPEKEINAAYNELYACLTRG